jgi:hypothetical protein
MVNLKPRLHYTLEKNVLPYPLNKMLCEFQRGKSLSRAGIRIPELRTLI